MPENATQPWPQIRTAGYDGYLISFGDTLNEAANRAALAFRAALEGDRFEGFEESSTSLVSAYLRFDPLKTPHEEILAKLDALLEARNWFEQSLPEGRRLWRVPTVFGGEHGPQLEEAASAAGVTVTVAIEEIASTQVRVQTIGFAPGMPYLGALPEHWNIPRLTKITGRVPAAGLCVAIRQLVLFPVDTPTGWRHIGQTAFRLFRPTEKQPFMLNPGDEVLFEPVSAETFETLARRENGGATSEAIA